MALFAELDPDTAIVLRVVVIADNACLDDTGNHSEAAGAAFCESLLGGTVWVETSYEANFRGKYAGIGDTYNPDLDEFIAPPPIETSAADPAPLDLPAAIEAALIDAGWTPPL